MDRDIFNQFLITEPSDSKPLVPDLVPTQKDSCPALHLPPPGSRWQGADVTKARQHREDFKEFSYSKYWTSNTACKNHQEASPQYQWFWTGFHTDACGSASLLTQQRWLLTIKEIFDSFSSILDY